MNWRGDVRTIPARSPASAELGKDQYLRVINTHGDQVVDTWAFHRGASGALEAMSMEHSRMTNMRLIPAVGDVLVDFQRDPMLEIVEDTSGGVHDTFCAACCQARYRQLGHDGPHDNCDDNLHAELRRLGLETDMAHMRTPCPLNLFQNAPPRADGELIIEPPTARKGGWITSRALRDLTMAFSACPMDLADTNGADRVTKEAHFEITAAV